MKLVIFRSHTAVYHILARVLINLTIILCTSEALAGQTHTLLVLIGSFSSLLIPYAFPLPPARPPKAMEFATSSNVLFFVSGTKKKMKTMAPPSMMQKRRYTNSFNASCKKKVKKYKLEYVNWHSTKHSKIMYITALSQKWLL